MEKRNESDREIHSEDIQEIVTAPPSWLLSWGALVVLSFIFLAVLIADFIKYPEVVRVPLKFNTTDAPKAIVNKVDGRLIKLLTEDGQLIEKDQVIAYMESTADHQQVLSLLERLKEIRLSDDRIYHLEDIIPPNQLSLGEIQGSYQNLYLAYLNYKSAHEGGIYQQQKALIDKEVIHINEQNRWIQENYDLQRKELKLAEDELNIYRKLAEKRIISALELQQKEAIFIAKQQGIPQMENVIINNKGSLLAKNRELAEINNMMLEEEKKFLQSLNSFISEAESWSMRYVLRTPQTGRLIFGNFLQENQNLLIGEELFYIDPHGDDYYGEMYIPQANSSKVKLSQNVLIKVRAYPYEEYGLIKGRIDYISDIPIRDSVFFSRVVLDRSPKDSLIRIKPGIMADAEIITEDQSILKRVWLSMVKNLKF